MADEVRACRYCDDPAEEGRDVCRMHHVRMVRGYPPMDAPKREYEKRGGSCSSCGHPDVHAKGLCRKCYRKKPAAA